jgi:hypothetical protein
MLFAVILVTFEPNRGIVALVARCYRSLHEEAYLSGGEGHHPIAQVEALALEGRVTTTRRVAQWLSNHDYDVKETVTDVLSSLSRHGRYTSSCVLHNGETADEYIVQLPQDDWYLKFWVDEDQLIVDVWSCRWDGANY